MRRHRNILVCLLLAWGVLLHHAQNPDRRLHGDEAFFLTFARHAAVGGDWWLAGSLDKPPLTIYANALSLHFFAVDTLPNGVLTLDMYKGEFAGRLFSAACAMLVLATLHRILLGLRLVVDDWLICFCFLPFLFLWLLYGTSAFMDMPMLAFGLLAGLWAWRGHGAGAGFWLAMSIWSKPQGVLFAPLIGVILWQSTYQWRAVERFIGVTAIGVGALWAWDTARAGESVFALGATNNLRLSAGVAFSKTVVLCVGLALVAGYAYLWRRYWAFTAWCVGYLCLQGLAGITFYERYWLPLVLLACLALLSMEEIERRILIARWGKPPHIGVIRAYQARHEPLTFAKKHYHLALMVILLLAFFVPQLLDMTKMQDYSTRPADQLADYLNTLPEATVVYYEDLGWELGYYMGQWTNKRLTHYDTKEAFWADFAMLPERGTRYAVGIPPDWADAQSPTFADWAISEERVAGYSVVVFYPKGN